MSVLYWFEGLRTPFLTGFMNVISYFGHELVPIVVLCSLYWCIDKRLAYKIGFSFFGSCMIMQGLKIGFRIDRPWVLDPNFKAVESAKATATGYSFPSGHTQCATSVYGSFAMFFKKWYVKLGFVLLLLLIAVSRLYLGVHTPLDVIVSLVYAAIVNIIVFKTIDKIYDNRNCDFGLSLTMFLISLALMVFTYVLLANNYIEMQYAADSFKTGGAGLAFAVCYPHERRYVNFEAKAPIKAQIVKCLIGVVVGVGLKEGLKYVLPVSLISDMFRYFVLLMFVLLIYPYFFTKILQKKSK